MDTRIKLRFKWYRCNEKLPPFNGYFICYNESKRIMWIDCFSNGGWTKHGGYPADMWAYTPPKPEKIKYVKQKRKEKQNESHSKKTNTFQK